MAETPRMGDSWDLVLRNVTLGRTVLTDDVEDAAVTFVLTQNGATYLTGSCAWEAHGYENAWVARFDLPDERGILVAVATASATIDAETVTGTKQTSISVV